MYIWNQPTAINVANVKDAKVEEPVNTQVCHCHLCMSLFNLASLHIESQIVIL